MSSSSAPAVSLPKGGGSISGIGETFQSNLFTGTGNLGIPLGLTPGRNGFGPNLSLEYSSGTGNGFFGMGWQLALPRISRKTEKGLPTYRPGDRFIVNGSEDLVPFLDPPAPPAGAWQPVSLTRGTYSVSRFRPRIEGAFLRIEQWRRPDGDIHWRVTSKDNVTSIYGLNTQARVLDPDDPSRVFEWLIEESFDARGNHTLYHYARDARSPGQCYPRRIYYGNVHRASGPFKTSTDDRDPLTTTRRHYAFEVIFDYGDFADVPADPYVAEVPGGDSLVACPERPDPFSSFRPGFEVRTALRCDRVWMVHHFAELGGPTIVRSTDFTYEADPVTRVSLLHAAAGVSYLRTGATYKAASTPPVTFDYSKWEPAKRRYQSVSAAGGDAPPRSFRDANLSWLDLFGNALPDIIQTTPTGVRYWKNTGAAALDRPRTLANSPAGLMLAAGARAGDVEGDGAVDLIVADPLPGFFRTDGRDGFDPFRPFGAMPTVDPQDPNVRFVDLTGDGLPDMLVSRDHHFLWFECLGAGGYAPPKVVERDEDLDAFPNVAFDDPQGRVRLVDMNGDGLVDIVVVHDGRIDYWPSMGYGRFGARVEMRGAPLVGAAFDPARLFLVDLDGLGCADAVYVEHDRVRFWLNRSGNGFSDEGVILGTPPVTGETHLQFLDLLGTGTATLVWSYDAQVYPSENLKLLDFCGGDKPYLIRAMSNNMGATTRLHYASSTKFYLEDEKRRTPWVTKLPFPVQVLERVETIDHIANTTRVSRYSYHHGYFDGREREFRGFGRVDQQDSETFPGGRSAFDLYPLLTKTWFHTGAYVEERELTEQYRREFYAGDASALAAGPTEVEDGLLAWEAHRALRGSVLRTEVYALDGSPLAAHPYSVAEATFVVRRLQPGNDATCAVFMTTAKDSVTHHYERDPADPRVVQQLTLRSDAFGNVTDSIEVAYPRRFPADPEQAVLRAMYSHDDYINRTDTSTSYQVGVTCQRRRYEVHGLTWAWGQRAIDVGVVAALLDTSLAPSTYLKYESMPAASSTRTQKRLIGWDRAYFRTDASADTIDLDPAAAPVRQLTNRLPLGTLEARALPYESFSLVFTDGWLRQSYGRDGAAGPWRLDAASLGAAGYHEEPDLPGTWWIPSGQSRYDAARFFMCDRTRDPLGAESSITYDLYDLLPERSRDAVGNETTAVNDYRVLKSHTVTDPNGNVSSVAFDILGYVVGSAARGKGEGDSLTGFDATPDQATIDAFVANPRQEAAALLGQASQRIVYDFTRFSRLGEPVLLASIARDQHANAPGAPAAQNLVQFSYFSGLLKTLQLKGQAEPGNVAGTHTARRWIGTGWTIVNNKQLPVSQFEPFFSRTHAYESHVQNGVSDTLFYDAMGRKVAVLHPNRTCEKVRYSPWTEESWDCNDTVLIDPRTDPDFVEAAGPYLATLPAGTKTWLQRAFPGFDPAHPPAGTTPLSRDEKAAMVAVKHANTPIAVHLDVMGRGYRTVTADGATVLETLTASDIQGRTVATTDPEGVVAFSNTFDIASRITAIDSADAGRSCMFPNVTGKPVFTWGSGGHRTRASYDPLGRPLQKWTRKPGQTEALVIESAYGEALPNAARDNLRGQIYRVLDEAGVSTSARYDFKGNVSRVERTNVADYKGQIDWASGSVALEPETFITRYEHDGLNRVARTALQVGTTEYQHRAVYNDAGLLEEIHARLPGEGRERQIVTGIDYTERGQRSQIRYANGITTDYEFDPLTNRLVRLTTRRGSRALQDLTYAYDPSGHVTSLHDAAFATVFSANLAIDALSEFDYDAFYRLTSATGREHASMDACETQRHSGKHTETVPLTRQHANDSTALRRYTQRYTYDLAGNLTKVVHTPSRGSGWTRHQRFDQDAAGQLLSHRLESSRAGCDRESTFTFPHDAQGRVTAMPHLTALDWDDAGRLRHVETRIATAGSRDHAYYVYGGNGARARKVIEQGGRRASERLYLSGFEIYREYDVSGRLSLQRETMHVMDDARRVALIETLTDRGTPGARRIRYQLSNHMESSQLEVDENGLLVSYEEYTPYGGTAYLAGKPLAEVNRKRYRYAGKERDDETGLYYFGARYYAPWLGRWISPDPLGAKSGLNAYMFNSGDPVGRVDPTGLEDHANETHQPKSQVESKPVSTVQGDAYYRQGPPQAIPRALKPLTRDQEAAAGIVGGSLTVLGGVVLAATVAGAPEGALLASTGVQLVAGGVALMQVSSGTVGALLNGIELATAKTEADHAEFDRADQAINAVGSFSGLLTTTAVAAGTGDAALALDAGSTVTGMERIGSVLFFLPSVARSVPSAAPQGVNLTRLNMQGTSPPKGAGMSDACGFFCVKAIIGDGTSVRILATESKVALGATDPAELRTILTSQGIPNFSLTAGSTQSITAVEQALLGYGDGAQFIVGYGRPDGIKHALGRANDHWVIATVRNGKLAYTEGQGGGTVAAAVPRNAVNIDVVVIRWIDLPVNDF